MFTQSCIKTTSIDDINQEEGGGYTVIGKVQTTAYVQDVIVVDTCAYIAQGQAGYAIVSINDPQHPKILSEFLYETSGLSHKCAYYKTNSGMEVLYGAGGGYGVASMIVTDKLNPKVAKKNLVYKPAFSVFVIKNYLFTMKYGAGLDIVSLVSNPLVPEGDVHLYMPGFGKSLCLSSDSIYALCACGEGGVNLLNVARLFTDNETPNSLSGRVDLPGTAEWVEIIPGTKYACVACGPAGLQIIDYSDTANIKLVGSFSTGGFSKVVRVADNRAYLACELQGVQIIDVSDVASPRLIGKMKFSDTRSIYVSNGYVYAGDFLEGLVVIKIP